MIDEKAIFQAIAVPNEFAKKEIKKATEKDMAMFSEFLNNLSSASFNIYSNDKSDLIFQVKAKSSKEGADIVMAMSKPVIEQLKQEDTPMLANVKDFLGDELHNILKEVIETLKVESNDGMFSVKVTTTISQWKKSLKIAKESMDISYKNTDKPKEK